MPWMAATLDGLVKELAPLSSNKEVEMNVRYRVELSQAERGELTAMLSKGIMLRIAYGSLPAAPEP